MVFHSGAFKLFITRCICVRLKYIYLIKNCSKCLYNFQISGMLNVLFYFITAFRLKIGKILNIFYDKIIFKMTPEIKKTFRKIARAILFQTLSILVWLRYERNVQHGHDETSSTFFVCIETRASSQNGTNAPDCRNDTGLGEQCIKTAWF